MAVSMKTVNESEMVIASSDDDEPFQIKRPSQKKTHQRLNLSDDEEDSVPLDVSSRTRKNSGDSYSEACSGDKDSPSKAGSSNDTTKKKQRRVVMRSDSDESCQEDLVEKKRPPSRSSPAKKKVSKKFIIRRSDSEDSSSDDNGTSPVPKESRDPEEDVDSAQQRLIMERLRSLGSGGESSEDDRPPSSSGRRSSASYRSEEEEGRMVAPKGKSKAPQRKSAAACRKAMQAERLKIASESQRMVRESKASLPYHKPRQRSLKEFLQARPKTTSVFRGAKFQRADINLIGRELEEREKMAEEFYKAPSEDEEEHKDGIHTPPLPDSVSKEETSMMDTPNVPEKVLKKLLTSPKKEAKSSSSTEAAFTEIIEKAKENGVPDFVVDSHATQFDEADMGAEINSDNTGVSTKSPETNNADEVCSMDITDTAEVAPEPTEDAPMECDTIDHGTDDESKPTAQINSVEKAVISEILDEISSVEKAIETPDSGIVGSSDSSTEIVPSDDSLTTSETVAQELIKPMTEIKSKTPYLKLTLPEVIEDACLTPSDATSSGPHFVKPAPKPESNNSKNRDSPSIEDSDDFKLVYEDSEDTVNQLEKEAEEERTKQNKVEEPKEDETKVVEEGETEKSEFDFDKLYNLCFSDDEDEVKKEPPKLTGASKILANLKLKSGPVKLKGGPEEVIDLDIEVKPQRSEVEDLVQRFFKHATAGSKKKTLQEEGLLKLMEAGEDVDEITHARPGEKLKIFKSELRESIARQRNEEFKKRQKEYQMYENEAEGLIGDDIEEKELLDEDEDLAILKSKASAEEEEEGCTESEPELEDDVVMEDAPRRKNKFMDEEAKESDQEEEDDDEAPNVEELLEGDEAEEGLQGEEEEDEEENSEEDDEEGEEEVEEEEDEPITEEHPPGSKKKFSRIVKVDDSDDETEEQNAAAEKNQQDPVSTLVGDGGAHEVDKSVNSVFDKSLNLTQFEENQLGIEDSGNLSSLLAGTKKDTADVRQLPQGITQFIHELEPADPTPSLVNSTTSSLIPNSSAAPSGLSNLFQDSSIAPADDLAGLCSGQFPEVTQNDKNIKALVGTQQNSTEDLALLCSGQFATPALSKSLEKTTELHKLFAGAESVPESLSDLCSGRFDTQVDTMGSSELNKLVGVPESVPLSFSELSGICSGKFETQLDAPIKDSKTQGADTITQGANLEDICSGRFETQTEPEPDKIEPSKQEELLSADEDEMRIVSDDEEDDELFGKKRLGKRKLAFSDDEEENEEGSREERDEFGEDDEEVEESQDLDPEDGFVDYDSEENEVIVTKPKPGAEKLRPKDFFDAEAELSESEWGSADEDERGLDKLEDELGDAEKFDENEVKEQLGKIHARRMLDEDKRDVRLFQEVFLEDGDLHSENGGRQRLFKWKNADDSNWLASLNTEAHSGDEGGDEEDEDEGQSSWRSERLQRESWLAKNKDKVVEVTTEEENSLGGSSLLNLGRSMLAKMLGRPKPQPQLPKSKPNGTAQLPVKSPSKVILQTLQMKSGSYLARRSISMTKVVALAGSDTGENTTRVSANGRNFVFSTISPSSDKFGGQKTDTPHDTPDLYPQNTAVSKKRPAASNPNTKPAAKKQKTSASVFQHL